MVGFVEGGGWNLYFVSPQHVSTSRMLNGLAYLLVCGTQRGVRSRFYQGPHWTLILQIGTGLSWLGGHRPIFRNQTFSGCRHSDAFLSSTEKQLIVNTFID